MATAYMEEAARFDWLVAMDAGRVLATGTPAESGAARPAELGIRPSLPSSGGKAPRPRRVVIPPRATARPRS